MRTLPVLLLLFSNSLIYLQHVLLLLSDRLHLVMKFEVHEATSEIYLFTVLFSRLPLCVTEPVTILYIAYIFIILFKIK